MSATAVNRTLLRMPFVPLYPASLSGQTDAGQSTEDIGLRVRLRIFKAPNPCPDSTAVLKSEAKTEEMRFQIIPAESFASQGAPNESNATSYAIGEEEPVGP